MSQSRNKQMREANSYSYMESLDKQNLLTLGHSFKLVKHRCNYEVRRHFSEELLIVGICWIKTQYLQSL